MNLKEAEKFIDGLRWQYAKTYPQAPHEYTVLEWNPQNKQNMIDFAYLIYHFGEDEFYYRKKFKILNIGEYKYWTMDFPLENTDLINRTYNDDELKRNLMKYIMSDNFKYSKGMTLDNIRRDYEVYSKNGWAERYFKLNQ